MKKITIYFIFIIFVCTPFNLINADGGLIPYESKDLYEPSQKSLIVFDQNKEDLYLQVSYEGDTNKFIWLVPSPNYPQVTEAPEDIFDELSELTKTYSWEKSDGLGEGASAAPTMENINVIVHSQEIVGIYEVTILSATGRDGLYNWLEEDSYNINEEIKDILDWYVQKEWYFTVMKIDEEENEGVPEEIYGDYIEPIKISFYTQTMIYPLKISQFSTKVPATKEESSKTNEVLIYALANCQITAPRFGNEYARTIDPDYLDDIEASVSGDLNTLQEIIKKEYFLTKIRRDFSKEEMDDDLYIVCGDTYDPISDSQVISLSLDYSQNEEYQNAKKKTIGKALLDRLLGKILIKVEDLGKAYYINSGSGYIHYLGRPADAFQVMREQSIGITNKDLEKIPIGSGEYYNKNKVDYSFTQKHRGKIFLQVEENGEAWYVYPDDSERYYLGRPADAFEIMRKLGLGISNSDFDKL